MRPKEGDHGEVESHGIWGSVQPGRLPAGDQFVPDAGNRTLRYPRRAAWGMCGPGMQYFTG
jgi:hypothetical protein